VDYFKLLYILFDVLYYIIAKIEDTRKRSILEKYARLQNTRGRVHALMHICRSGNGAILNKVIRAVKVLRKPRPYPKGAVSSCDVRFIVHYVSDEPRVPINRFPVSGQPRKRIWLICQADFTPVYVTVIRAGGREGVRMVIPPGANSQTLTIGNRFLRQRAPRRDVPAKSLMARKKSH